MKEHKIVVFGGSSLYRLPIYNQMAKEIGCDFYIFEDDPSKGIESYDYKLLNNFQGVLKPTYLLGNFYWQKGTIRLILKPYDLYIVGSAYCLSYWILILLAKFKGRKVASWSHGLYGREKGVRKLIKTWYYKICNLNYVYNDRAIELMVQSGIKKDSIIAVGNSLDTYHNWEIRKTLTKSTIFCEHFKNNYPVLIFVGRVTAEKRLDMILDAMSILEGKGIKTNLIVIGKDIDCINLDKRAEEVGLKKNLWLYGPCYDENILGNFFYNASLCVSPGNVGLTAINSMTFGCPVITHNNLSYQGPEYAAIKPGITGDFFNQGCVEDLSSIIKFWTSKEATKRRNEIRQACYNEVDNHWTIYNETNKFKNSLEKIINTF